MKMPQLVIVGAQGSGKSQLARFLVDAGYAGEILVSSDGEYFEHEATGRPDKPRPDAFVVRPGR